MKNIKLMKSTIALFIVITLVFTAFVGSTFAAETTSGTSIDTQVNSEYLEGIRNLIREKYNGNFSELELEKATTPKQMFELLDDYSVFFTMDEAASFYASLGGSVEGIGVQVQMEGMYVIITKVFKGSPAWNAGVLAGDKIVQVNGKSVAGQALESVTSKVKGPAGTKVKLGLMRQGIKNIVNLEIARAKIELPTVTYEIRGNVGYILIDSFSENAYSGVVKALAYFDSKKITKVVLDLRNNPGGYLDQAVSIAQLFVPKGVITKLDYKDPDVSDITYYSSLTKLKYKLAVLVNGNSASASEVLTGAIRDTKAGVVVGTKTFGKAKVQNLFPIFKEEIFNMIGQRTVDASYYHHTDSMLAGYAKITVGLYYTPNGDCIDLKGIEPNIKVAEPTGVDAIRVNLLEDLTVTVKPNLGTKYTDVYYAECILKLLNYKVDKPDTTLDRKTFEAIKKFQKDNKVYSYGVLDFATQKLLNKKLAALKQTKDSVYAKAVAAIK